MPDRAILAIDQGTTNTKAVLVAADGAILARGAAPVPIEHPQPGWVQQDAEAIWQSVLTAIAACLADDPDAGPVGLGISNQRESVMIWDRRSGKPLGPVVTWQCRRTTAASEALKARNTEAEVLARTGLPLDPLFPALKLNWLLEVARQRDDKLATENVCAGTVDSWLVWRLTAGAVHATDRSNAARTQLFNLGDADWDDDLCALFDVPRKILPAVHDSQHNFGTTKGLAVLPDGIPVGSAIGDSHAALFGHCAFRPGDAKATFGTGASVMATVPSFLKPEAGLTTTIAWSLAGNSTFAFEGNILVSASVLPWTAELLGLGGDVDALMALAESVPDTEEIAFVPALVGLGAPHWAPAARGLISGISFAADRRHVARAAAESMAFQVADVFRAVANQSPAPLGRLFVDGGPSRNRFLMGMVADLLDHPVQPCDAPEVSAQGAAYLAGLTVGFWDGLEELEALPKARTRIDPSLSDDTRRRLQGRWQDALARCLLPAADNT